MKKFFLFVAMSLMLGAMATSCKSKPKLLTEAELISKVDSMYQVQVETLGSDLDAACDAKFDDLVQTAVDSIMASKN